MSHEITIRADGFAEMAYTSDVSPWHRLGNVMKKGASLEDWQKQAGMDYMIRRTQANFFADRGKSELIEWPDQMILYRSDNKYPLGIVSPDYQIVQPYEILEFFRDLIEGAGFQIETAGTLFGGRKYWVLAKITEAIVAGWDKIGSYCLISTSADGSTSTDVRNTSVCVVCRNTLEEALSGHALGSKRLSVSHRQRFDEEKVKKALGLNLEKFPAFIEAVSTLTTVKMTSAAAEDFLLKLLRAPKNATVEEVEAEEDDGEEDVRRPRGLDAILTLFEGAGKGSDQKGRAGTAWGLVNAVTEYVDHHATAKTPDHLIARAWLGSGAKLKSTAFQQLYSQVTA
jgi:phage/plasmid-like protein (TIGR03299 family)